MFCNHTPEIQSKNFVDGLVFTRDDRCLWVVYPGGAAGDLLISILDRHYLRTGCEYYGINDQGRVILYTSDYEMIDLALAKNPRIEFDDQWFFDFSDQLGNRNLTYSMLDQVIFGCHMHRRQDIQNILDNFSKAQIINIYARDKLGQCIIKNMCDFKLKFQSPNEIVFYDQKKDHRKFNLVNNPRVLNVPFGFLFNRNSYDRYYSEIRNFLGLPGPLICFEYVEFYLSKQNSVIRKQLEEYSQSL